MSKNIVPGALLVCVMCLLPGCATEIHPSGQVNHPPQVSFDKFNNVQLNKAIVPAKYAGQPANEKAVAKIDVLTEEKIKAIYPDLNKSATSGSTLIIAPEIIDIKFIGGGARFWAGAMAGSSAVLMKVKFIDKATGNVVAYPEFYSKCSAMAGSVSIGGNDNAMLHRVASEIAAYISANRVQAAK